jgi:hypothetical protein
MRNEQGNMSDRAFSSRQPTPLARSVVPSIVRKYDPGILVIVALFVLLLPISLPRIYATDEVQYYAYLRSVYFDGDLDFRNEYTHFADIGRQNGDLAIANALLRPDEFNPNPITGKLRNVAPVGSAIMWAPGFVLADLGVRAARALGATVAADGYSRPYIWSACFMSALYVLGGLLLTYRLARRFAGAFAALLATVAVWLATPLVMYTFILMPWSHATGFFLFALFLTVWLPQTSSLRSAENTSSAADTQHGAAAQEALDTPITFGMGRSSRSIGRWALLGLIGGLMTITREQLGLLLLLPAAEAIIIYVNLFKTRRWNGLRRQLMGHAVFLVVFVLALTPQLLAYQLLNGRPLPSSTVGGKLKWCSPHFVDTLIDYDPAPSAWCPIPNDISVSFPPFAHGAFLWSPILLPAVLGLAVLGLRGMGGKPKIDDQRPKTKAQRSEASSTIGPSSSLGRANEAGLLAALLLLGFVGQTYINGAFGTTWHLTRSFGFRRLIECTPIFVLGLAPLIAWLRARAGRALPVLLATLLIAWNIGLIAQWTIVRPQIRDGLEWSGMLHAQLVEVPGAVVGKVGELLFDRCRLANNDTC